MAKAQPREIELYITADGKIPFSDWLDSLIDKRSRSEVNRRIERATNGNFGDHKSVGNDVYEMRITYGGGYRIYYAELEEGNKILLLLLGGVKSTQVGDIKKAKEYWDDYKDSHQIGEENE